MAKKTPGYIGIDIGGTKSLFGLFDQKFARLRLTVKRLLRDANMRGLDGKLYRGATGVAGDIGNYLLHAIGPLAGSDREGVLDDIASRTAIAGDAATLAAKRPAPALHRMVGSDVRQIKSSDLARAIGKGDRSVERLARDLAMSGRHIT